MHPCISEISFMFISMFTNPELGMGIQYGMVRYGPRSEILPYFTSRTELYRTLLYHHFIDFFNWDFNALKKQKEDISVAKSVPFSVFWVKT